MLRVNNPILTNTDLLKIKNMKVDGFKVAEIPITYYKNTSLEKAIEYLFIEVDRVIREGANILILTDREVDEYHVAIPSLRQYPDCSSIRYVQRREPQSR